MSSPPIYIAGIGITCPLGPTLADTEAALTEGRSGIAPLDLFPLLHGQPLPVGQAPVDSEPAGLPRTHRLAWYAARQAMAGQTAPPDGIIIGTTTGGILTTEELLRSGEQDAAAYRYHGLTTVAEQLARRLGCHGPALSVSTACSSGAVAITLAMRLLQRGILKRVLVGGADSLCRLTYFGFHCLQLVDRTGCKPLDLNRQGMSVAEGAALLLLTAARPVHAYGILTGAGLSCDAYHPAAPHPEGRGAFLAMQKALEDAGHTPDTIGYLNLHGTGTPDNDQAEARAVNRLFSPPPPLSSTKGASGHTLAASGAIEAAIATLATSQGLLPATNGCRTVDPALNLRPLMTPQQQETAVVLSNSFGFGGNNCALVIERPGDATFDTPARISVAQHRRSRLCLLGSSCLTGAGDQPATLDRLLSGSPAAGTVDSGSFTVNLPPRLIRRLKRLPRMALSLAAAACKQDGQDLQPTAICLGTGWGALSETYDFLERLASSGEQFPSPTDFVGSVHNAPASQIAIMLGATGANITTSGGNYSFEQALLAAHLILDNPEDLALALGVDEGHPRLSPLLDASVAGTTELADGGGAFIVGTDLRQASITVTVPFYRDGAGNEAIASLLNWCGGGQQLANRCGAILAGIPRCSTRAGEQQLAAFLKEAGSSLPVIRYRPLIGEYAAASATAAVLATLLLKRGNIPETIAGRNIPLTGKTVLLLGLGENLTAMEFMFP